MILGSEDGGQASPPKDEKYWLGPIEVLRVAQVYGGDIRQLVPEWNEIPEPFREERTRWNQIQTRWFYRGLPRDTLFQPKYGIDAHVALRHLGAIMSSMEPKSRHKAVAVAWLLSLWFDEVHIPHAPECPFLH